MSQALQYQAVLEQLRQASSALGKGNSALAREILLSLGSAQPTMTPGLDAILFSLVEADDDEIQGAMHWLDQTIEDLETKQASTGTAGEASPFKVPRPATLSQSGPLPLPGGGLREEDKETRIQTAISPEVAKPRLRSLTDRLQKVLKNAPETPEQAAPDHEPSPEQAQVDNAFDDIDLGLSTPPHQVSDGGEEPVAFTADELSPPLLKGGDRLKAGSDSAAPFIHANQAPDEPHPMAPGRQVPGRMRQQTPLISDFRFEVAEPAQTAKEATSQPLFDESHPPGKFEPDSGNPIDEEEFFALAESLASEASDPLYSAGPMDSRPGYRGEPVVLERSDTPNPFIVHEAPTGVRKPLVKTSPPPVPEFRGREPMQTEENNQPVSESLREQARSLYEAGEFRSALDVVKALLSQVPDAEALQLQSVLEGELERVERERIGSLSQVPRLIVNLSSLSELQLDHRAGFLLSQVDGMLCYEDIIDMSSMTRLETMTLLADLQDQGIISGS